ncbi:MAG: hypothetical protein ACJAT3_002109, partial [Akkermansiaceae bacterium]
LLRNTTGDDRAYSRLFVRAGPNAVSRYVKDLAIGLDSLFG